MNKYHEAVKKGGDNWNCYFPIELALAHAANRITQADFDYQRMYLAEKYTDSRRAFQSITYGI